MAHRRNQGRQGRSRNRAELIPGAHVRPIWLSKLRPSPENALLYRERSTIDADFDRLVVSIRRDGVQAPLLVSVDAYIVSGHQRARAAQKVGLRRVPCIVLDLRRSDHTTDEWLAILREHNTGRDKTFDERVREALVDVNPGTASRAVVVDRIRRGKVNGKFIQLDPERPNRNTISAAKQAFVDAILGVINGLHEFWPLSIRQIHYNLLNGPPLRNSRRPGSTYRNDRASYQDLSDILTRLRLDGRVSWYAITDENRPVCIWRTWRGAEAFVQQHTEGFLRDYSRDLLQSQPSHVEIIAEKLTLQGVINPVASRFGVTTMIGRGYSSIDARHGIATRFRDSGKANLILLCLSDCDPDGDAISQSLVQSMRADFEIEAVQGIRVALTHEQARELRLPPLMQAKETSSQRGRFVAAHGTEDVFELESVPPQALQHWLDEAIRGVLDLEALRYEQKLEQAEAVKIEARRRAAIQMMKGQ